MEPQIQYARTSDGVSIAYSAMGEGPPLVYASEVWGDIRWYTYNEPTRQQIDAIVALGRRVVRYDIRGMGSSDRDVVDLSLEGRVLDLEAVVDDLGLERFPLCGYGQGGPTAIAYSARHPERVSHLIVVNSFASGSAYYETLPAMRALVGLSAMAEEQWEFYTLTLANAFMGFEGDPALARETADLFRGSVSAATFLAFVDATREIDLLDTLPSVSVPTLVIADSAGFSTLDLIRPLAKHIRGARLVSTDDYTREALLFLGDAPPQSVARATGSETAVILFADIVDSTSLTERIGDAAFRAKARTLDTALRTIIADGAGTTIDAKTLGDGVLATFSSASQAIDAALRCGAAGEQQGLPLHLGLHAGDVIREQDNVFGGAVNIAARISGLSAPGELLVSDTVRSLARTSAGVSFEDRGEHALKGVADAQRVYAVRRAGT